MINFRFGIFGKLIPALILILAAVYPVSAKDKPVRTIKVKLVADEAYARQSEWPRKAAAQLMDVADEAHRLLEVNFEIVEYETWKHKPENNLYRLTSRMISDVPLNDADVLIGFTFGRCPEGEIRTHTDGVTVPFRGMIVRVYPARCPGSLATPYVIIHEMVHLLGGLHVGDGSLMSPVFRDTVDLHLDRLNRQIVNQTRDIDFHRGYASLNSAALGHLARLYYQAIKAGNREAVAFSELGAVYLALGENAAAEKVLDAALTQDSAFTRVWINLARCRPSPDQAIATLTAALDHADDPGAIYARLAQLYFDNGDKEAAHRHAALASKHGAPVDSTLWDAVKNYKEKK
jgi:tetratricopeptide (TPR) repeat protein